MARSDGGGPCAHPWFLWDWFNHFLSQRFYILGQAVGRRPYVTIIVTLVLCVSISAGALAIKGNSDYHAWTPNHSRGYKEYEQLLAFFPDIDSQRSSQIIFSGENVLTVASLAEASNWLSSILGDLWKRACQAGPCKITAVPALWNFSAKAIPTVPELRHLLSASVVAGERRENLISGFNLDNHSMSASAHCATMTLALGGEAEAFESEFIQRCLEYKGPLLRVSCQARRSYPDENARAQSGDTKLMGAGIGAMIIYLSVCLGRFDRVHSKVLLGLTIMLTVGLALGVGFGISAALGVEYTAMSMMAIFIMMGVGIDDAFIINGAYERTDPSLPPDERLGLTFRDVASSIFFTSLTDLAAFATGATIDLPAISWFCVTAGLSVVAVFVVTVTFFSACLILDDRRARAGRWDFIPCKVAQDRATIATRHSTVSHRICHRFTRALLRRPVMVCVILGFLGLCGFTTYIAATRSEKGIDNRDYIPDDSYLFDFWDDDGLYFQQGLQLTIVVSDIDLKQSSHILALERLHQEVSALPFLLNGPDAVQTWWPDLKQFISNSSQFDLHDWARENAQWRSSILLDSPSHIRAARFVARVQDTNDRDIRVEHMDLARAACLRAQQVAGDTLDVFPFTSNYLTTERHKDIDGILFRSIFGGILAVGLCCMVFMRPAPALAVLLCVFMINLNLLGFMAIWQVKISVAPVALLVLALGFSVDYSAHIAIAFSLAASSSQSEDTGVAIAAQTLTSVGISVMHGGLSTLMAVFFLAFSKSGGFVVMFRIFLIMVVSGLAHGLVFLPCLLAMLHCPKHATASDETKEGVDCVDSAHEQVTEKVVEASPDTPGNAEPEDSADVFST